MNLNKYSSLFPPLPTAASVCDSSLPSLSPPLHGSAECEEDPESVICTLACAEGFAFATGPGQDYRCRKRGISRLTGKEVSSFVLRQLYAEHINNIHKVNICI